jgi:hypothetical protein
MDAIAPGEWRAVSLDDFKRGLAMIQEVAERDPSDLKAIRAAMDRANEAMGIPPIRRRPGPP